MSEFKYPNHITSAAEPRSSEAHAVEVAIMHLEQSGDPITSGSVLGYLSTNMTHGRVQQILYWLGYRALEGTIKPYGRGHTWVWHKPRPEEGPGSVDWVAEQQRINTAAVFGTATGKATSYEKWRDVDLNTLSGGVWDVLHALWASNHEVRIQVRSKDV